MISILKLGMPSEYLLFPTPNYYMEVEVAGF
jgi:hypothetical protein